MLCESHYKEQWEEHQLRQFAVAHFLKVSGRYVMYAEGNLGKGDFNVYRSFAELALTLTRTGGYAGQILQSGIYAGANSSAIRRHLLDACTWKAVYGFNNKGGTWFPGVTIDNLGAYAARVGVKAPDGHEIRAAFGMHYPESLSADLADALISFDSNDIRTQNPDTYAIPDIRDAQSARLSRRLYKKFPGFGQAIDGLPSWSHSREIDMDDKDSAFRESPPGIPIYEGRMIDYFDHRAKRYLSGHGNSSLWKETPFGDPTKGIVPQWYVEESVLSAEVRARIGHFRVGFMDIADPGRQRSFVSAFVPPSCVCGNTVPTAYFEDEWYAPVYLAIANSLVVDFLVRQRVLSKHIKPYILDTLPIARLNAEDDRSAWLADRALRLTCTSVEMTPLWNAMAVYGWVQPCAETAVPGELDPGLRRLARAEIDAFVAAEVYEISRRELELILDSFVQLEGIERKAHGEFLTRRLVLTAFDEANW